MADGTASEAPVDEKTEDTALQEALAALHTAVWGYGVVGDALPASGRAPAETAEAAHRDLRDRVAELLDSRKETPVAAKAGYALPFPVLSAVDAAALGAVLENGVAAAWVRVLGQSAQRATRELAVGLLSAAEVRAVTWRIAAGKKPVTRALPGL